MTTTRAKGSILALLVVMAVIGLVLGAPAVGHADTVPSAQLPVVIISAGQSAGIFVANALADRVKLPYDWSDVPTAKHIASGSGLAGIVEGPGVHVGRKAGVPDGTPYKTVIFVIGASLKGMGASGLSLNDEVNRLREIIKYCQDNKVFMVGMHVEGKALRGKPGSDNEVVIDAVAPFCNYLIVTTSSNHDDKFTDIGKAKNIPVSVVSKTTDIAAIFQTMFGLTK